jgi:type IV pilus assembly protein PilQ
MLIPRQLLSQETEYLDSLKIQLEQLAKKSYPGLNESVEFSVSGVSVKEFLRSLASNHSININVRDGVQGTVINNFSDARVLDVIIFLCKEYGLRVDFMGSIMSFYAYHEEVPLEIKPLQLPKIDYNEKNHFLSLDLQNDTLDDVLKEIVKLSFVNVIAAPEVKGKIVSVFIQNRPLESALEMLAVSNNLRIEQVHSNFYVVHPAEQKNVADNTPSVSNQNGKKKVEKTNDELLVEVNEAGLISVTAFNQPIKEILAAVSQKAFVPFFLYDQPEGNASIYIENTEFDDFMDYILNSSNLTFRKQNGVYLIGARSDEVIRTTELIQLENRTIESILDFIPADIKKGVEIKEFKELNGFVMSGSRPNIEEIKRFLFAVDKIVPIIRIEVMIIDFKKSHTISGGIDMKLGIGDAPATSSGQVGSKGGTATLNSSTINTLLSAFNGYGLLNLGMVKPDFYMTIQALEANGNLKVRSTPMLSTLNGHQATMKIGNTEYYLEVNNSYIGSQNPITQQQQIYKSTTADLSIDILPIVSSDGHVTLEITVGQSDFTDRISDTAPPGKVTREFKSLIRVKNGEMILLGGLEEKKSSNSGKGLPFISRVPVLKWIFGSRAKVKSQSKLNIFIKPVVIY